MASSAARNFFAKVCGSFSNAPWTISLVWRTSRIGTILLGGFIFLSASLSVGSSWLSKDIVDAVVAIRKAAGTATPNSELESLEKWVAILFAVASLSSLVESAYAYVREFLSARLSTNISIMILKKASSVDLTRFEDPEFNDILRRARVGASSRPLGLIIELFSAVRGALMLAAYAMLLARLSIWAPLALIFAALPSFTTGLCFSRAEFKLGKKHSPEMRRLNYLENILTSDRTAHEVKFLNCAGRLLDRYTANSEAFEKENLHLARKRTGWSMVSSIISDTVYYLCYFAVAVAAAYNKLTLGEMTFSFMALRNGRRAFETIFEAIGATYESNLYISNLIEYLNIPIEESAVVSISAGPKLRERGIRFENVGYRYPDNQRWAIRGFSLYIPNGQKLAIVGENGAGKTTLIKLLTRLYVPTEGRIYYDGKELSDWNLAEYRKLLSVQFQDFNRYRFTIRENVTISDPVHLADFNRIKRAMEYGDLASFLTSLPDGLDTQLGRVFDKGTELSGGQWQKLALARMFFREEAEVFVVDEPTAALDAKAELKIVDTLQTFARAPTAIFITHRFPTARLANHIVVIDQGRLSEEGTHDALVESNGLYAKLFSLQARGYS